MIGTLSLLLNLIRLTQVRSNSLIGLVYIFTMSSSIVQILASKNLSGDNYTTQKSNLNSILVIDDLVLN